MIALMMVPRLIAMLAVVTLSAACSVNSPPDPPSAEPRASLDTGVVRSGAPAPGAPDPECRFGQVVAELNVAVAKPVGGQIDITFSNRTETACRLPLDLPTALLDGNGTLLVDSGPRRSPDTGVLLGPGDIYVGTVFWDNWCREARTPFTLIVGYGMVVYGRIAIASEAIAPCADSAQPPRLQPVI